jgi:ankyrin repeat protein
MEIVKLLLERGADINAKSDDGTTALKLADGNGKTDVAALLRARGRALRHDLNRLKLCGRLALEQVMENRELETKYPETSFRG